MTHTWDDGETLLSVVVSECTVCGGFRVRDRVAGLDYSDAGGLSLDTYSAGMVGKTDECWRLCEGTPDVCPGTRLEVTSYE